MTRWRSVAVARAGSWSGRVAVLVFALTLAQTVHACSGKLARLLPYAGGYHASALLAEPVVARPLERLLGPELGHLRRNLVVAGSVDLVSCDLVVLGNAEHAGGEENAIVAVDLDTGSVSAAILSRGPIDVDIDPAGAPAGSGYDRVPLAVKNWLAVVYTRFYFRSRPPAAARLVTDH